MQQVNKTTAFDLRVVDLRERPPDEREDAAERYVTSMLNRPLDLARAPRSERP